VKRLLACLVLGIASVTFGSAEQGGRVFGIRCVNETNGTQRILYSAEVEGAATTDFRVVMRDGQHEIEATFVNEPLERGGLDSRVRLRSRRAYGTSRNGLRLWEEDVQQHRFRVARGQQIEMLPFGAAGEAGLLKLDVSSREATVTGPMQIRIGKEMSNGAIQVDAYRGPHWLRASVLMTERNRVIARGEARLFIDETTAIALHGDDGAQLAELRLVTSAVQYENRWRAAAITFDGAWSSRGTRTSFAQHWSGAAPFGVPMQYDLADGKKLSIILRPEGVSP
jgi:hypothetical protein